MPPKLEQIVLYKWKAGLSPERIAYHFGEFRALVGKVDGLLEVRGGPRKFCYMYPSQDIVWDDALILTWRSAQVFSTWGTHPEHDRLAPGLLADVEKILSFGVEVQGTSGD